MKTLINIMLFSLLVLPIQFLGQSFNIDGIFTGKNTEYLVLRYSNESSDIVVDTLKIKDKKFEASGTIGGVQRVFISGNTTSRGFEDPNFGYFFLEPGKLKITLAEEKFKEIEVTGSATQTEFMAFKNKNRPLWKELNDVVEEVKRIESSATDNSKSRELRDQWMQILEEIEHSELAYASSNRESKLSAYFVNFYQNKIPRKELKIFYDNFSPESKNTIYGEGIRKLLGFKIPSVGNKVPAFKAIDLKGNELNLSDFAGKYVLLDFWAGWCKPCLEKHPALKELYKKYSAKGFEIVGFSLDKDKKEWKKNIQKENLDNWPQVFIGINNVRKEGSLTSNLGIQPIPAYILIGPDGEIIAKYLAADAQRKDLTDLENKLKSVLR